MDFNIYFNLSYHEKDEYSNPSVVVTDLILRRGARSSPSRLSFGASLQDSGTRKTLTNYLGLR
ncbi:MAG: hypothetical protein ACRCT1_11085 [Microcoleaceae cyanobacterium]|jgi:hypothetical protein